MARIQLSSTWGTLTFVTREGALSECALPMLKTTPSVRFAWHREEANENPLVDAVRTYVQALFAGQPAPLPPYHFPVGTTFQQAVWRTMLRLQMGETCSYGELADRTGYPGAARAVGGVCRLNPLPLIIPCHRVVGSQGQLGGFSCGLAWKKHLLSVERSPFS